MKFYNSFRLGGGISNDGYVVMLSFFSSIPYVRSEILLLTKIFLQGLSNYYSCVIKLITNS